MYSYMFSLFRWMFYGGIKLNENKIRWKIKMMKKAHENEIKMRKSEHKINKVQELHLLSGNNKSFHNFDGD